MTRKSFQIAGIIFIIIAGILYTLERCANWIANGLSAQGLAVHSGNGSLGVPWVSVNDNVFVTTFVVVGIVMFLYGFLKKQD
ncbi:hypothetical protein ACFQI7_36805 [Paenibacillus allorhizosphaerae]|uniref:Uncharacterized protein n=1 Tax=Paenibacillus allorhizosphaerae TaxID=2849866 RepID=A0ABN7TX00_9BACL|nr:hypothetical protein [Paenibacillus allorhizosphaerae]CAG7659002.1 hypothetical protein PAECIP111802_07257 [Paenibacillus allorhizosphaerae]